ncbi:MAG: hypothetical protein IPK50_20665 [Fibrobacterota bacterium]|nr:MAG: hypothetical protein IPK50_20665 [Fibrobacterota bacterium]
MNPASSVRFWISIALCLFFTTTSVAATPKARSGKNSTVPKNLPTTFEGAVDHLIKNLKKDDVRYLKSYPKCDLISFHFGWGMGIRNDLGLWRDGSPLLQSCALRAGKPSIHPDEASGLLIHGVWDKLHEDILPTDFDTVSPANYFREIDKTLRLAKSTGNVGYLASLPLWMYQVSRLSLFSGGDTARSRRLSQEAHELARRNDSLSPLAILYMTFHGGQGVLELLDSQFVSKEPPIELPSFTKEGDLKENFLLQPDSQLAIPPKTIVYFWRTLSRREFAAKCFGSFYNKTFQNADEYERWSRLRRTNPLVRWAWKDDVSQEDLLELSSDPRRFLEVVLLTNRFFYEPGPDQFPLDARPNDAMAALVRFMGLEDSVFQDLPYDKRLRASIFRLDSAAMAREAKAVHAMVAVANRLSVEELLRMLDWKAAAEYNRTSRTEDLQPYKILGHTLLAAQTARIVGHPDKKRTFDLCLRYWKEEFLTWRQQDFLTELLFQIDPQRAREVFLPEFRPPPVEGSFSRNAILAAMIRQDFAANRQFLKTWFWKTYNRNTDYHPNETQAMLRALESQEGEAKELLKEITSDRRYRRHSPKLD